MGSLGILGAYMEPLRALFFSARVLVPGAFVAVVFFSELVWESVLPPTDSPFVPSSPIMLPHCFIVAPSLLLFFVSPPVYTQTASFLFPFWTPLKFRIFQETR